MCARVEVGTMGENECPLVFILVECVCDVGLLQPRAKFGHVGAWGMELCGWGRIFLWEGVLGSWEGVVLATVARYVLVDM